METRETSPYCKVYCVFYVIYHIELSHLICISAALALDFAINIWDIRRPYVPHASFLEHKDVTTGIAWRGDLDTLLSTSRVRIN